MSLSGDLKARLQDLPPSQQLGHIEYLVDSQVLERYRAAVDYPAGLYPNLTAREAREVLTRKVGNLPLTSLERVDRYYTPPILGRRVQVTGWLREVRSVAGPERLVIETFSVDEIGTEVIRSLHTFVIGEDVQDCPVALGPTDLGGETQMPTLVKLPTSSCLEHFSTTNRTLTGSGNLDPGDTNLIPEEICLSYLHELADRQFGIDFRQGGRLTVKYHKRTAVEERLAAGGSISAQPSDGDRKRYLLRMWVKSQSGDLIASGDARVTVPSPLT